MFIGEMFRYLQKVSGLAAGFLFIALCTGYAQPYDIVIKNGHVIDPKNQIDRITDVAIQNGKIALVANNISTADAAQTIDATGLLVTPGLIDMHVHVFYGNNTDTYLMDGATAVVADAFSFRSGVTTFVDAGSAGWRVFPLFKKNVIDRSKTRVLAFLNIVGAGMRGGAWEQDTTDMNPEMAAAVARENKDYIVGFKVAHFAPASWTAVDNAVKAGQLVAKPVMVDFGGDDSHPPLSIRELFFNHLRPGDIYTHVFTELQRRDPVVDIQTRKLRPFVKEAQNRGIFFDVGFGGASFNFNQAWPATRSGFFPNSISTDLHTGSMNSGMKDMLNVMSAFLALRMPLTDVIRAATWNPAIEINRKDLGNLSVGADADVTLLNVRQGNFGFFDVAGNRQDGDRRFECAMTIRAGRIVYDLNGIAKPVVLTSPK